jgi:putative ABC transport system permease protein
MTHPPAGQRWYQRLLRAYPRDFRDEFGREMARLYRDRARGESVWSLWCSLIVDLLRTAPREHLSILRQDVRQALRGLRRTPIITATAILTLAIGVGASTAVFSLVQAVLLRPLPYPEPQQLVELSEENFKTNTSFRASALNYLSWVERSRSFDAIGAFRGTAVTMLDGGDPELVAGSRVTAPFFRVLRIPPLAGRTLQPEDEQRGSPQVVVIGESLWRSRFGADRHVVGRAITLDGEPYQVVGVMPREFREVGRSQVAKAGDAQVFLPLRIDPAQENRGNHTLRVVGRLHRDVTLEQARREMRVVTAAMEREFPATNADSGARMAPVSETMLEPQVRRSLLLVFGAVAMVFLIACVNVANLLLARGARRQSELSVRTALGAGRSRLVRQLLTESACLAFVSGAAGIAAAAITQPLLSALLPATLPRLDEMRLDASVLAFGLAVTMLGGLVFGIVPALRASRLDPSRTLTSVGRTTPDPSRVRLRQALVASEVALSTMLLVCAALLLQGFVRLQHAPLGFDPDDVLTARISLPRSGYPDAERPARFYERLLATLRESGQVQAVAVGTSAPFATGVRVGFQATSLTKASAEANAGLSAAEHVVSGDFFRVLGIPIVAGRTFSERDKPVSPPAAIVTHQFARAMWSGASPLGQRLERNGRSFEVVGMVGDVRGSDTEGLRGGGPDREPRPAIYLAAAQFPQRGMTLLIRPSGTSPTVVSTIRRAVRELDPALAVQQVRPLQDWLAESLGPSRLTTTLAALFAGSALLLTAVGIYGVLAFSVAARTREIGIRMAIGAARRSVIGLVLRESMAWAAGGMVCGLIAASAAARFIAALLYGIEAQDPLTFATVGGAIAVVALMAGAIPAMRAVKIDPTIAMRAE